MRTPIQQHEIENFFDRYDSLVNEALTNGEPDIDEAVNSFATDFIEASPNGVIVGKNEETFREAIVKGWAFYREIGIQSMDILSSQITILDNFHAMVKIHWNCSFIRKNNSKGDIAFDVHYFLQKGDDDNLRIFGYITGDEQQALKDEGLI
jgi:hypothetical protein